MTELPQCFCQVSREIVLGCGEIGTSIYYYRVQVQMSDPDIGHLVGSHNIIIFNPVIQLMEICPKSIPAAM